MVLTKIDSVPIYYQTFSIEFNTWLANLVDGINYDLGLIEGSGNILENAPFILQSVFPGLTNAFVLTAGTGITITFVSGLATVSSTSSGTINPGLINDLAFYAANGTTLSPLATAASSTLVTDAGGVPSLSQTLPLAVQTNITELGTITLGTWHASVITEVFGGTGQSSYILGDILYASAANTLSKLAGNTTAVKQYLSQTGTGVVSAAPVWATISGGDITGAALTKVDDTNVTLTLGGSPTTALLRATSLTLGWTGVLSLIRGGTNASLTASNGGIVWSNATQLQILAGTATARQMLQSGSTSTPAWSSNTWPNTTILGDILYGSTTNVISSLAGNITAVKQYLSQTGTGAVSAAPIWATISGGDITGAALTKTDDTNVTLTLGGSPTTALLRATSLTLGWTGTLAVGRGGTAASSFNINGVVISNTTTTGALASLTLTDGQIVIGSTIGAPLAANITSSDSSITVTNGHNTISLTAASGAGSPLTTKGDIYAFSTVNGRFPVATGDGKVLQVSSGATFGIAYSTPTYPSASGAAGKILRSDATNNVYTTSTFADTYSASNILYSNGANTVTGLATVNNGLLVTSASGVPSIASTVSTDISGTVTITGFSAITTNVFRELKIGKMVFLSFSIAGTSNATTFTVTGLPDAPLNGGFYTILVTNAATNTGGLAQLAGTTIIFYNNFGTSAGVWTATGLKQAFGAFWYEAA